MEDLVNVLYSIGCFLFGLSVPNVIKKIRKKKIKARRWRLNALIIERNALLAEDDRYLQEKGADNFKTGLKGRWLK